ncbi:hypothetical protein NKH19_25275 [Mesorhizobium sp. M1338]|uniref:hypothetical protein n=1 Tax=unclassified Mesorhizobium TaxID=325217 RepID=UPI003336F454
MAKEEFQANWRGARKYQFDEETRRKQAALDRKFPDPEPAHLPQPNEPVSNYSEAAADLPKSRPGRRGLVIATMLLLFAIVASIAGYVTIVAYQRQQIAQATNPQPQASTANPSLPLKVLLPPSRPRD